MSIIIDSSVWIEYFRNANNSQKVDFLIDEDLVVINELILAELVPFLKIQNQNRLVNLLDSINKLSVNVSWSNIIELQYKCLKNGLNGVGIPDLIIVQNALQYKCKIFSLDKHFVKMADFVDLEIFGID